MTGLSQLPWEKPFVPPSKPKRKLYLWALAPVGLGALALAGIDQLPKTASAPEVEQILSGCPEQRNRLPDTLLVDPHAQAFALDLLDHHPSVLTVAVVLDLATARPLVIAARSGARPSWADLLAATSPQYPMASLAKIVTTAASLDAGFHPESRLSLFGQPHTLYKFQITPRTVGGTEMPLAKAFALSVNPIFGSLGVHHAGQARFLRWADTLGFFRSSTLGAGVPSGVMRIPIDTYNLAETSSGFVRTTLISPVHAAMIARRFGGDGRLTPPRWDWRNDSACHGVADSTTLARSMDEIFRWTVDSGTARKSYGAAWPAQERAGYAYGGKTGSLDGDQPKGRYEWFTGFVRVRNHPDSGIALAVMTVNDGQWNLSASWTAAQLMHWWTWQREDLMKTPVPSYLARVIGQNMYNQVDTALLRDIPWSRWNRSARTRLVAKR